MRFAFFADEKGSQGEDVLEVRLAVLELDGVPLPPAVHANLQIVRAGEQGLVMPCGLGRQPSERVLAFDTGADLFGGLGAAGDVDDAFAWRVDQGLVAFIDGKDVLAEETEADANRTGAEAESAGPVVEQAENLRLMEQDPLFNAGNVSPKPIGPLREAGGFKVENIGQVGDGGLAA